MRISSRLLIPIVALAFIGERAFGQDAGRDESKRMVLVELYTSQGCDMCPTAEKILGALAERDARIVPIAFHVDYFNDPWKDVFSDPLYSQRQMAYNQLYTRPKNPEYGLYYTPMLMIDGEQSVNGRDPAAAQAAIRQALARKPAVAIDVTLDVKSDGLSGTATIKVTSRSPRAEKTPLLVCAVLREDGVVTDIPRARTRASRSSLASRRVRRNTSSSSSTASRPRRNGSRSRSSRRGTGENLRLAVFVQDKRTGVVHQATDLPWRSTPAAATPATSTAKAVRERVEIPVSDLKDPRDVKVSLLSRSSCSA